MSKFAIHSSLIFIFFFILSRFLFPFSDEADISLQFEYIYKKFSYIFDFLQTNIKFYYNKNTINNCGIVSSPLSLWTKINQTYCATPINAIIFNILFTFVIVLPILFINLYRKLIYRFFIFNKSRININHWNNYLDAVSLSLVFSGFLYFIGVISLEKITLALSLLAIIFIHNFLLLIPIILLIFYLDPGNFTVLFLFLIIYYSLLILNNFLSLTKIFVLVLISVLSVLLLKDHFFHFLLKNPFFTLPLSYNYLISGLADNSVYSQNVFAIVSKQYPVIFRLFSTFMGAIFYTPHNVKIPLAYIYNVIGIIYIVYLSIKYFIKMNTENQTFDDFKKYYLFPLLSSIITIFLLVSTFPTNAYAKYYIFLLPIFFNYALIFCTKYRILYYVIINNFLVFYFLILYRF